MFSRFWGAVKWAGKGVPNAPLGRHPPLAAHTQARRRPRTEGRPSPTRAWDCASPGLGSQLAPERCTGLHFEGRMTALARTLPSCAPVPPDRLHT